MASPFSRPGHRYILLPMVLHIYGPRHTVVPSLARLSVFLTFSFISGGVDSISELLFTFIRIFSCRNVTKKWWNIRDGFIKSRKRQREALKSGSGASKVKKYVYEDHLQFLVKMSDERQNEVDVHDQVSGVDNSYDEDNKSLIKPQKRKLDQNDSNFMENSENRHFSFFKGVVQSLNYFDDEETIQFQMVFFN
ncbi:hypothetical protein FQR65_LT07621 [Abscondita terminalis]|nr:hypothetical protein FQR65_LT07621 [Abscondita terminalis]